MNRLNYLLAEHRPTASPGFLPWMIENGRRHTGEFLDPGQFPHVYAKNGPAWAIDQDCYTEHAHQWATRLGKTTLLHQIVIWAQADGGEDSLFASATEKLVNRNRDKRLIPIARFTPGVPTPRSSGQRIDFKTSSIHLAWSGSDASLGDLSARVVACSEVDKWSRARSTEADPLRLAAQRAKEFPDRKIIYESTPSIKGRSRIESAVQRSTNHRFYVPCPHCGNHQVLTMGSKGNPREDGGIIWDKIEGEEHSDPDYARLTARYCCAFCHDDILDHHRAPMMRAGVWAGEGQTVDRDGEVSGELPDRTIYGTQLSSLYSLSLSWGYFAYQFLTSKKSPAELQDFINGDLGETFSESMNVTNEDDLAERLGTIVPMGVVPDDVRFLTAGVDLQEDRWVWVVMGWGIKPIGRIINYGETESDSELIDMVGEVLYENEKGKGYKPRAIGVDSGFMTDYVYQVTDQYRAAGLPIYPIKGMTSMRGKTYTVTDRAVTRGKRNTKKMLLPLIGVNTNHWQEWLQRALDHLGPDDEAGISFPLGIEKDRDFLAQLLNEGRSQKLDRNNYAVEAWQKIDPHYANDFRDCVRYARVMAEVYKGGTWRRQTAKPKSRAKQIRDVEEIRQRYGGRRDVDNVRG